jgi:hypothetical protein
LRGRARCGARERGCTSTPHLLARCSVAGLSTPRSSASAHAGLPPAPRRHCHHQHRRHCPKLHHHQRPLTHRCRCGVSRHHACWREGSTSSAGQPCGRWPGAACCPALTSRSECAGGKRIIGIQCIDDDTQAAPVRVALRQWQCTKNEEGGKRNVDNLGFEGRLSEPTVCTQPATRNQSTTNNIVYTSAAADQKEQVQGCGRTSCRFRSWLV